MLRKDITKKLFTTVAVATILTSTLIPHKASASIQSLNEMRKHCAELGRNVGINPDGEFKCGSARSIKRKDTDKALKKVQPSDLDKKYLEGAKTLGAIKK